MLTVAILSAGHNVKGEPLNEFDYFTRCVQAEAGNQDFTGKRLVAAVILNRVADERFPDTITDVINAPHQFSVVSNGSINSVDVDSETIRACWLEMNMRSDTEICYFNNSRSVSGKFCYKWGKHYFAK